jgi:uncharacterized membrane protein
MFSPLVRSFFRGLLVTLPLFATVYIIVQLFSWLDGLVPVPEGWRMPFTGAGVLVLVAAVTLVGWLASNVLTRWFVQMVELLFSRLPLVKLIYSNIRDLIGAFVGDSKKFDQPVAVTVSGDVKWLGFLTREDVDELGVLDHVGVYFPQSYNFAGQVMLVPRERVTRLKVPASDAMSFIVSGGVAGEDRGEAGAS